MFKSDLKVTFVSQDEAELDADLDYVSRYGEITVKAGFRTDFASVPGYVLFPGIVPKVGRIRSAAVVHDWLYRGHELDRFTRRQSDVILFDAAIENKMSKWRAAIAFMGVRIGGWITWRKYHKSGVY
jgi:hypothetical protein